MADDHTSGEQRAAEREATAEQRAEWAARLHSRLGALTRQVQDLATAATAHGTSETLVIAIGARRAVDELQQASAAADYERARSGGRL